jgi:lysophospholipase L1-like esterase
MVRMASSITKSSAPRVNADAPVGRPRQVWLGRSLAIFLGILVPLLAFEAVLRIFGPIVPGYYDTGSFLMRHPTLGHFHVPNFDGWRRAPEFTSRISISPLGLRDPRGSYAKPAGTYRILLLGDSFIEATQVQADEMIARRLEVALNQGAPNRVEVINAGVGGYSTGQELLLLEEEGVKYEPDLVVLFFFSGNDLSNNNYRLELWDEKLEKALKPYFDLDRDGTLRFIPAPPPRPPSGPTTWLRHNLVLFNVVETGLVNKFSLPNPGEPIEAIDGLRQPVRGQYDAEPEGEWLRAWKITEMLVARLHDRTVAMGIPLVMVGIPESRALDRDVWQREVRGGRQEAGRLAPDAPTTRVGTIAQQLGVPYLDLLPPLTDASGEAIDTLYYRYDRHWNADGHAVAAEALAQFLRSQRLTPRG